MLRPGGYAVTEEPDKPKVEQDTFTCGHCNRVVFVPAKAPPAECGGFCRLCWSLTCSDCDAAGRCTPFEKKLEAAETRSRLLASIGSAV